MSKNRANLRNTSEKLFPQRLVSRIKFQVTWVPCTMNAPRYHLLCSHIRPSERRSNDILKCRGRQFEKWPQAVTNSESWGNENSCNHNSYWLIDVLIHENLFDICSMLLNYLLQLQDWIGTKLDLILVLGAADESCYLFWNEWCSCSLYSLLFCIYDRKIKFVVLFSVRKTIPG